MNKPALSALFITLHFSAVMSSQASAVAGRVLYASGPNSVERDGPTVGLSKGSYVFEGDTIHTGMRGRLQLQMVDGARIAVRPNTSFAVVDYQLAENTTVQGYEVTKLEAVYHVVEHFAQHAGQIMFVTKLATAEDLGFYGHLAKGAGHGESTP